MNYVFLIDCTFLKKIIYLFMWQRDHKQGEWQAEVEGEADSLLNRKPDAGLNPRTLGSWPEPKVDT